MKISEIIMDKYKLRIPPTVYYDLLADVREVEEDQEPTTKNDLEVDAISRRSVIKEMEKRYAEGDYITKGFINSLPSVTPIRPKGHWIEQIDHEENCRTLICSNCDRPALHDGDSIWKHKFCPHCGADMREVEDE